MQVLRPKIPVVQKMCKKMKEPKDLKVKIGTKKEAMWTSVRNGVKTAIEQGENELIVNKELLKIAENHIKIEQQKGKSLNTAQ